MEFNNIKKHLNQLLKQRMLRSFAREHDFCHSHLHRIATGSIRSPSYDMTMRLIKAIESEKEAA